MTIEIVDLPIFHSFLSVYQRVNINILMKIAVPERYAMFKQIHMCCRPWKLLRTLAQEWCGEANAKAGMKTKG